AVTANGKRIVCDYIVIATHTPLMGKASLASAAFFQTKLMLYTSYALAGRVPKGRLPQALFWEFADPYHYLRVHREADHDLVIFGGEDHKTGQVEDTVACYTRLEMTLKSLLPDVDITHRWSGQVVETNDRL